MACSEGSSADAALEQRPLLTYECLEASASRRPEALALTFHPDGLAEESVRSWTYRQLLQDVRRAANGFSQLGVGRSDTVAIILPALAETHIAIWGAEAVGVAAVFSPALETSHLTQLLQQVKPKVVVCPSLAFDGALRGKVAKALNAADLCIELVEVDWPASSKEVTACCHGWDEWLARQDCEEWNVAPCAPDDLCALFHTGGTTGAPKVARHTHRMQAANAHAVARSGDVRPTDVMLSATPLFHVSGIIVAGLAPFSVGAHVVILTRDGFRNPNVAANFWKIVERWGATTFNVVPTILSILAEQPIGDADISSLRSGACGAAPLSPDLERRISTHMGRPIVQGYGCTEATCAVTVTPANGPRKFGSVGKPVDGVAVMVAEVEPGEGPPRSLRNGQVGAVLVQGASVFPGYLNNAHSVGSFRSGGWLDTGDLGRLDEDGYLWLVGRAKDLIIRGGHNIDPAPIEEALMDHPDVLLAAAVGQPDRHAGEVPCAFVSLRSGALATSLELMDFVADRLPERASAPAFVEILTAMPLTPIGKVFKPTLRLRAAVRVLEGVLAKAAPKASALGTLTDGGWAVSVQAQEPECLEAARAALAGFTGDISFQLAGTPAA